MVNTISRRLSLDGSTEGHAKLVEVGVTATNQQVENDKMMTRHMAQIPDMSSVSDVKPGWPDGVLAKAAKELNKSATGDMLIVQR